MERDELLRIRCFLALDALRDKLGDELPYADGLDQGFVFDGRRVPFMNRYKGIHHAQVQRGRAVLSIQTSWENPYADGDTDDGFGYAYRSGDVDQADNRSLREASALQAPIVYFVVHGRGGSKRCTPHTSTPTTRSPGACFSAPVSSLESVSRCPSQTTRSVAMSCETPESDCIKPDSAVSC